MKKILIKLIIFSIPIILLLGYVEYFYRTVPNNYSFKKDYLDKNANKIETLLLGSSHCFYGLNPKYFKSKAYNLSNISQTIYFDQILFDKYINNLTNLKKIVLCIEYTNLSQKDDVDDAVFRKYYYQKYMDLSIPLISKYDYKQYFLSFTRSRKDNFKLIKKYLKNRTIVDCDANGWGNNYLKKNRISPYLIGKQRAIAHEDGLMDFGINKKRIQLIINKCVQKNIKVYIVSMPQTEIYTKNLNQVKLNSIFMTCKNFEKNNNVFYLNLFKDARFIDDDFYDADHLNEVGAEKCSKIVNEFLLKN